MDVTTAHTTARPETDAAAPDGALAAGDPAGVAAEVAEVDDTLRAVLTQRGEALLEVSDDLRPMVEALLVAGEGGKRLRATFCLVGARSVSTSPVPGDVEVAGALELFHLAALVHDDLMDRSETRRGEPTVHHRFAVDHRERSARGESDHFGATMAVLAGDLCLTWSDDLLARGAALAATPGRADAVRACWSQMRDETLAGQYLDVLGHTRSAVSPAYARRVLRYKSAKYTVEQPLVIGGRLAGAPAPLLASYAELGLAAGEAFQLRDDLLGVFGDPAVTGKPVLDDVREGKQTLLVSLADAAATPAQRRALRACLGDPDLDEEGLRVVREVLQDTGAVAEVEQRIAGTAARALELVTGLPVADGPRGQLAALIGLCAWRDV